jgi:(S)-2-hydroxyglutarate dehydrogenase
MLREMNNSEDHNMTGTSPTDERTARVDIVVVGGGVVGLATAMALTAHYRVSLAVIEAEERLAAHQTGHNSGVIHSGLYYKPGSLKARLCAEGRQAMYRFAEENGIAHERCGKVVVALDESELPALAELERRGQANGLEGLRRLSSEEIREHEPHVSGIAGLRVPETGIIDYKMVAHSFAERVRCRGGKVRTSARLLAVAPGDASIRLRTTDGDLECRGLINCAGLHSDRVARMCGLHPEVQIIPFRGEYYKLAREAWGLCRNLIYPVPNPAFPFLGVHFTRMIGGGIEAGPNAVLALSRHGYSWGRISPRDLAGTLTFSGFWRMARKYWRTGFGEMHRSLSRNAFFKALRRLLPELQKEHLQPGGSGVRAQAVERSGGMVDDFRIQFAQRMVHVLNAPSPAATASISIGRHIAATAADSLGLEQRSDANGDHSQSRQLIGAR